MNQGASVISVLRSMQRDDIAIKEIEDKIQAFSKFCKSKNILRSYDKFIPDISSLWYYYITSGNNIQTLGEEYSYILRFTNENTIPSRFIQLLWLILYIGGEPMFNTMLLFIKKHIKLSNDLREEAKQNLLKILSIWHAHKKNFEGIHRSLFYINGNYYSFGHRITGIKYILLRDWLQDSGFARSFKIVGYISLIYYIFNISSELWHSRLEITPEEDEQSTESEYSSRLCALCNSQRKSPSAANCGHIFCWNCIHESLNYQRNCPLCREEVDPSRIIFLQNYV
ncbi:hypothetical protein WA026_003465 [Henosepilachna vigintioctopunctata]|uniref:RING-type E3 ubiquitin transferase n=1 Tax=Henosepilachna vigintioctopunctata TaxID=420089 RepID=A0AAW1TM67_9CUCU